MKLTSGQCRVLSVLMEKSLASADAYPMTLNAITAGCNQKNNRDPVTSFGEGDVGRFLHELGLLDLVSQAPPALGARANRFRHEVERKLGWGHRRQAIMAELMLRGPQTTGELKGRIARMGVELDIPGVQVVLDELAAESTPYVTIVPRLPGQSSIRFGHTLTDEPAPSAITSSVSTSDMASVSSSAKIREAVDEPEDGEFEIRLQAVESGLEDLRTEVARLRARIDMLSG